jgi:hypothetical protein
LCCATSPAAGASEANERRRSEDERAEARLISAEDDDDAETRPEEGEAEARVEKKGDEFRAARAGAVTTGKTRRNMFLWQRERGGRLEQGAKGACVGVERKE